MTQPGPEAHDVAARPRTVALAGQPNAGKSSVFNYLTGLNQHVGNWPGKTVARKEGPVDLDGAAGTVVDLPGTYSLTAGSEEERIARDFLLHTRPDVVIVVADASALERSLYLLTEVLALPVPVVVGLNMMDVAAEHGVEVEPHVLAATLGVPVVPLVARRGGGLDALLTEARATADDPSRCRPDRPAVRPAHQPVLETVETAVRPFVPDPYPADWVALKLLEGDTEITDLVRDWMPEAGWATVYDELRQHEDAILDIAGGRYEWIERMVRAAVRTPRPGRIALTDRLDRWATHPVWGLGILFAVFALVFAITFEIAQPIQDWLDANAVAAVSAGLHTLLAGAPRWLEGLVADGLVTGVGTVATFLPILAVFYTVMGLLEDTGYLARVAYIMDRFMHAMGLHGKSALPLVLGFGCNVPSVMGARTIDSRAGRLLTILLVPLVPCSARLAVLAVLAPAFFGGQALFATLLLVGLNLAVLGALGMLLHRTAFRDERAAFIMELPLYHRPNARTIGLFVYTSLRHFLHKAGTVIVVAAMVIWALSAFPGPGIEASLLAGIGRFLSPAGDLMGFDWRLIAALLSSFVAKEVAVATLGILYGLGEEATGLTATMSEAVAPATGLAFLAVVMLFIPCVATVGAMRQETGSWFWTGLGIALLLAISLAVGVAIYQGAALLGVGGAA